MKTFEMVALGVLIGSVALAHWDTHVATQRPFPLIKEIQAVSCEGVKGTESDKQANGGKGGSVAYLEPGASLTFEHVLNRGFYSIWIIARARDADFTVPANVTQKLELPGGATRRRCPRPVVYATLRVKQPDGVERSWYMPIAFRTQYGVVSRMHFPLHVNGRCEISVGLDARSAIGLLVDRVEVRDVFKNCARRAAKTKPMVSARHDGVGRKARLSKEQRIENDGIWSSLPKLNLMTADRNWGKWNKVIGRDSQGLVWSRAKRFESSGAQKDGWVAAIYLCALAEKYPGLDFYYSEISQHSSFSSTNPLRWGTRDGKSVYSGWSGKDLVRLAEAYDKVFDFVDGNQALADYLRTKIAWIRTPNDVVEFLDTSILQHGTDCLRKRFIRSDYAAAFLPLIQGVNDVSRKMLDDGLFEATHFNMANAGGLDDQAFTSYSRGGVHYIGSTLYVSPALEKIASVLRKYREAGGDPKYDISDSKLYPHVREAAYTKQGLHLAGGFPAVIGDAMDLRRGRHKDFNHTYPSRVLEGFGAAVLEDGQASTNPLVRRGLVVHTGIGRGHAHQDMLNIEIFAHGCRLAPDLGGRHSGSNRASPNMRTNRMHNVVWIDRKEFQNTFPGSTTSATGWTTSFSPLRGMQYMANAARATSHPQVSLYQRSTAMIDGTDVEGEGMYVFDVFRVKGGKEHVYCFHGAYADELKTNAELADATSDEARALLKGRPAQSMKQGIAGDLLEATWPLRQPLQKRYQREHHQADRPVSLTLSLFGQKGKNVYVGDATSGRYPVDMPYLHVKRAASEGAASVFPAIFEPWSGKRVLRRTAEMKVMPEGSGAKSGVAVRVELPHQRKDVLFSSLKPETEHRLEDGTVVSAEFAFVSKDSKGLRAVHLVGGTALRVGELSVRCRMPSYRAKIESVDLRNHRVRLSTPLPKQLLDGSFALFGNPKHLETFEIAKADGKDLVVRRTPRYYQSKIIGFKEKTNIVDVELEPVVHASDTDFCIGTTVTNEAHDRFWRAELQVEERWMHIAWPGTRLSYPDRISMKDIPDIDGDGKHTLKLIGSPRDEGKQGAVLLELEVTRTDPTNTRFYFKMPSDKKYQAGGWQYAHRKLVNEDGSRAWIATYPGTQYSWKLKGDSPVNETSFADSDGDGKRKLMAYHFGPGDEMELKTFVGLKRISNGRYEVRANVPCSIKLPGTTEVSFSVEQVAKGVVIVGE